MIAADRALQRPPDAKLLSIDSRRRLRHLPREELSALLRPGDLVVANDAATLPASLEGTHIRTRAAIEVRLAGRRSLDVADIRELDAVVFGEGDFRVPTERRPPPPALRSGDELRLGPLHAVVQRLLDHPRLVTLRFDGTAERIWEGIARHGRPIQYSHLPAALALWDVWTSNAALPVAFEAPSAGFILSWKMLAAIRARGGRFATLTHAAGISSTGDPELDRRLPFDEPYYVPSATAREIRLARLRGARIIAIGTTVVRALEHAADARGFAGAGFGIATQRLGPASSLKVVDAILSGTHEPGTSHFELLRAFVDDETLSAAAAELEAAGYRTHEFGDSVLIERSKAHSAHSPRERKGVFAARQGSGESLLR
ncbi:MAG TPA: S-adenosylmethionine:tRNA ribosyltransferase-isomerase [Gammaproteobacteria bacterium]|nr:S-adenosylmethionine:tRNA ribosyltransferase-isomerase [Gammaproteobacteria bacterium]